MFNDIIQKKRKLNCYIEPLEQFWETSNYTSQEVIDFIGEEIKKEIDKEIIESVIRVNRS